MPDQSVREVELQRAAYIRGMRAWVDMFDRPWNEKLQSYAEAEATREFPMPPAKVWRCACGATPFPTYSIKVIDGHMYHWNSEEQKWCGPVEEVEA